MTMTIVHQEADFVRESKNKKVTMVPLILKTNQSLGNLFLYFLWYNLKKYFAFGDINQNIAFGMEFVKKCGRFTIE